MHPCWILLSLKNEYNLCILQHTSNHITKTTQNTLATTYQHPGNLPQHLSIMAVFFLHNTPTFNAENQNWCKSLLWFCV